MQNAVASQSRFTGCAIFQRGGIRAHAYPCMLYFGAVFGEISATRWAEVHGLPAPGTFVALILLLLPALVGARLLFVAFHWELYRRHPRRIWQRNGGGAALYGGLLLAFPASLPLLRVLAIPPLAFWDATAIALLIGMVFTRIGCCLHGCCAGRPSDGFLALYLPDSRGVHRRRLPAQLFEACLAALILPGSIQAANRIRLDGALFLCSLAAYAAGRWMLEPTRETIDRAGGWSLNRIVSAALVVVAATAVLSLWVAKGGAAAASH